MAAPKEDGGYKQYEPCSVLNVVGFHCH